MSDKVRLVVGGSPEEDGQDFIRAWEAAERGKTVVPSRVLAFESWETMTAVLTGERVRLLRHLHRRPEPSVLALSQALGRRCRRVHGDVAALEAAGLVDRSAGQVVAIGDRIAVEVRL